MANPNSNGYYGGSYYPGPEEGPVGNTGNEFQPPSHADISTGLQAPHHGMHTESSFQPAAWFGNMYMGQIYPRPPSQESIYNGHGHYMTSYSPEEAPGVPSGLNMSSMMAPQPPHTPSPNGITNGHDHHHSSPSYYNSYVGLGTMTGAPEGVTGCPAEVDSTNHNLSSDSANMAMQSLTLNPVRGSTEENGIPHDERSVDWTRRRFPPADHQSAAIDATSGVEGVEIKQEVADQTWRVGEMVTRTTSRNSSSGSPFREREEHETRENNWKAGKTRTKDKYRVVYSDNQRIELEREFHYGRYITIRRKAELASQLGLSERQVKIWFQNQRAKKRNDLKKKFGKKAAEKMEQTQTLNDGSQHPHPHLQPHLHPHSHLLSFSPPPHQEQYAATQYFPSQIHPMYDFNKYPGGFQFYDSHSKGTVSPNLPKEEVSMTLKVEDLEVADKKTELIDEESDRRDKSARPQVYRK